jgi:enterochelin esterase-like enzyme
LGYSTTVGTPTRLAATPWSYLQADAASNARFEYTLLYEREAIVDPRNPRQVRTYSGLHSEIRMPFYESPPEIDGPIPAATGTLTEEAFASRALKGTRRVWTYLPAGYEGSTDHFPTVYVLDGGNYVADWMGVPGVLDRLIAAGSIRPVIAVFVEPGSRQEEYSRNPAWRAFVTSELVPAIDRRHRTFSAPEQRVVFGSSLAAYGAVDLAVAHPDVFAACAALAPPSQTPTLLTNQAEGQRAINGVRFFVLGAVYDPDVNGARALRTVLAEAAGAVTYLEVPHGHAAETFRAHVDEALEALLPAGQ